MRRFPLILFLCSVAGSLTAGDATAYPLWDGQESVEQYARRVNLAPAQTLDLGNGVKLELVLIPAGKFVMGTPEPAPINEDEFRKKIVTGQALLVLSGGVVLVLLAMLIVTAIRRRRLFQFSLIRLLLVIVAAGGAVLSGMHWRQTARRLEAARVEYAAAKARFDAACNEEKPAHVVTLTKPFYMGKYVVTQEQYAQLIGANPSQYIGKDNPVEQVSWNDAQTFFRKLSELTHQTVRLPTEAEWEYGCRAGTFTTYYSGDTDKDLDRVAWYDVNSKNTTHPVGQKEPNVFGLYDMHGNVFQWCEGRWDEKYYSTSPAENPEGPAQGRSYRMLRGGYFVDGPYRCRSAYRYGGDPDFRSSIIGFRVVAASASKTP